MALRIRIRLESLKGEGRRIVPLETSAVVNSGFETDQAELVLPVRVAERLGMWPIPPPGAQSATYEAVTGDFTAYRIPKACKAAVLLEGQVMAEAVADVVIIPTEREVILSDAIAAALGIAILQLKPGLWRFVHEKDASRPSEPPDVW